MEETFAGRVNSERTDRKVSRETGAGERNADTVSERGAACGWHVGGKDDKRQVRHRFDFCSWFYRRRLQRCLSRFCLTCGDMIELSISDAPHEPLF